TLFEWTSNESRTSSYPLWRVPGAISQFQPKSRGHLRFRYTKNLLYLEVRLSIDGHRRGGRVPVEWPRPVPWFPAAAAARERNPECGFHCNCRHDRHPCKPSTIDAADSTSAAGSGSPK